MLLTQSSWASVRVLMCLDEMGSNSRTSVCSQATVSTDLSGPIREELVNTQGEEEKKSRVLSCSKNTENF